MNTNVYYSYHNGKSCITNNLQDMTSDLSVTPLLRDGDPNSCLVPGSLTNTSLRVVVPMSSQSSQLFNIWVLADIQDCSPGGRMTMMAVDNYGESDFRTSCVTVVSARPGMCLFRCRVKKTEYVVLNIAPRDEHHELQICEIYIAWHNDSPLMWRNLRKYETTWLAVKIYCFDITKH